MTGPRIVAILARIVSSRLFYRALLSLVVVVVMACLQPAPAIAAIVTGTPGMAPSPSSATPWPLPHSIAPRDWTILGPFPTDARPAANVPAIDSDFLAAAGGEPDARLNPTTAVTVAGNQLHARKATLDGNAEIDLARIFQTNTDSKVAYAYSEFTLPRAIAAVALFGSDDSAAVWLNGRRVHRIVAARAVDPDADHFPLQLVAGSNRVLIKVENRTGWWGFALRILDEEGQRRAEALRVRRDIDALEAGPADKNFRLGDAFPTIEWGNTVAAHLIFSDSSIATQWFDEKFDAVTQPEKPGRYFAVIQATMRDGCVYRRILTFAKLTSPDPTTLLARVARPYLSEPPAIKTNWPTAVNAAQAAELSRHMWWAAADYLGQGERGAIAAAAIAELATNPAKQQAPVPARIRSGEGEPAWLRTAFMRNAELQLGLRMKLEGRRAKHMILPEHLREPAGELRPGNERQAGMKPGTIEKLRAVAKAWHQEDPEPLIVLVARQGIVFMHEGFGAAKTATFYPASIGKAIGGLLFARAAEQGLLGFDDPVAATLPDWADRQTSTLTYRQCFAHLSGLRGHASHDGLFNAYLDNSLFVGDGVFAEPGRHFHYNGDDIDLAGKALELTTGRTIWRLLYEHMQKPFDEPVTEYDLGFGGEFTAAYLAKVGQMILQDGSYGNFRFFRPGFLTSLRPKPLATFAPSVDDPTREEGIAQNWMVDPPGPRSGGLLGPNVLGHAAASGAIWRVDLDHQLVVVIGRSYKTDHRVNDSWTERFMKVMADGLAPTVPAATPTAAPGTPATRAAPAPAAGR